MENKKRLIDGNALIEWFRPYGHTDEPISFDELCSEIRTMPTVEAVPVWIPVTERLPETDDFVLVVAWGQYKNIRLEGSIEFANYSKEEGWILEMWPEWENPQVTYWMQVPKRPED